MPGPTALVSGPGGGHHVHAMQQAAFSVSPSVAQLMDGPILVGTCRGHGMVAVGSYIVCVGRPGDARLPNGIQIDLELDLEPGRKVAIGDGMVFFGEHTVLPGPVWDPRPPVVLNELWTDNPIVPDPLQLAGTGPGLWPAGDQLLAGYAAGLTLFRSARSQAEALIEEALPKLGLLSRTLGRHAAAGELPEQAHHLLATGDAERLLRPHPFVGRALMVGLALAGERPQQPPEATPYLRTDLRVLLQSEPVVVPDPPPVLVEEPPPAPETVAEQQRRRRRVVSPPTGVA